MSELTIENIITPGNRRIRPIEYDPAPYGSIASLLETKINFKEALLYNVTKYVYDIFIDNLMEQIDIIQDKIVIGVSTGDNAAYYYLEKIDKKSYDKYTKNIKPKCEDDTYFIGGHERIKLLNGKRYKFYFKDKNYVIVKNEDYYIKLYFVGNHREAHFNNYLKFFKKYGNASKRLNIYTIKPSGSNGIIKNHSLTTSRSQESIICKDKEKLFSYLDTWSQNQNWFRSANIAHKVGVLLDGPPGTGKTSLAKVIATRYNLDIVVIDFKAIPALISCDEYCNFLNNSVVLLEDIDCLITDRNESHDNNYKEQFQALLQLLDGIKTLNKTIFVATTNNKDKLDPALVRDGRFDLKIHMGDIDKVGARLLCKNFDADESILEEVSFPVNPAYLQNKIITKKMEELKKEMEK